MPTTTNFSLTYPASTDHVRLWEHFQTLAEDVDGAFVTPICRLRRAAAQALANNTDTALSWDTEDVDSHSGHDLVTNPTRYTIQLAGWYQLTGGCGWPTNATGRRTLVWRKNGAVINASSASWVAGTAVTHSIPARPIIVSCAVNDYIELYARQESGGSLDTTTGADSMPSMDVVYLRPA
jgi:hypothetical protein